MGQLAPSRVCEWCYPMPASCNGAGMCGGCTSGSPWSQLQCCSLQWFIACSLTACLTCRTSANPCGPANNHLLIAKTREPNVCRRPPVVPVAPLATEFTQQQHHGSHARQQTFGWLLCLPHSACAPCSRSCPPRQWHHSCGDALDFIPGRSGPMLFIL